jgi:hypothetical protein
VRDAIFCRGFLGGFRIQIGARDDLGLGDCGVAREVLLRDLAAANDADSDPLCHSVIRSADSSTH